MNEPGDGHCNRGRRQTLGMMAAGMAAGLGGWGGLVGGRSAHAQGVPADWPGKQPIRILCGFAPGGTTDPYARMLGDYAAGKLGTPVVVENRPGAGGFIALEALSRSPADGFTLGVTTSSSVWGSRALYRKIPFNADQDFVPISWLPVGPLVFAVPVSLGVNTVDEWVEMARNRPMSMASYGPASVPHLAAEEFNKRYKTKVEVIHYKGEGPMWPDVSTGVTQGGIGSYVALSPHLARGTVKVLATVGEGSNPKLSTDIKSMTALGYDSRLFTLSGGLMMLAPRGTPDAILERFAGLFIEAADSPKGLNLRDAFAISDKPSTVADVQRRWRDEAPVWIQLTEALNIKVD